MCIVVRRKPTSYLFEIWNYFFTIILKLTLIFFNFIYFLCLNLKGSEVVVVCARLCTCGLWLTEANSSAIIQHPV